MVACFPKSGSTFVTRVLSVVTASRMKIFHTGLWYNEQNLDEAVFLRYALQNTVTHQHLPGTPDNVALLDKYGFITVVLVRNIFDTCVSLYDHFHNESLVCSECYLTEEFFDLDEQRQLDCVVDLAVPWYLKFYVSWYDARRRGAYRFMWARYEDMLADSTVFFMKIMDHCGIAVDRQRVARAVEELQGPATRFNKGVAGRGQERLSADQQARIRRLCSHYPHIDFADLGI